ncbi:MAG TPA: methylmalonyl Co-A mutase-associated GTPase MeaB [Tenuifilaceae bacterium]|nr:methylmalonyl Co-A mutase-associated GTPase MeaB [Tenuifilaceae bacterium]
MTKKSKGENKKHNTNDSALIVNPGIEQPSSINQAAINRIKQRKNTLLTAEQYFEGILQHNVMILSKAITLVESSLPKHREVAHQLIDKCLPYTGNSIRIGITGVPGVGKSTFIEALGSTITGTGHKLAVLAIDPSSERSKGSILGDKTRMETLSADKNAYIRPSPSAGSLGGVARKTRETVMLCEAAGFDTIFIETVGVGQSEVAVHSMVDFFLLLMLAGAGDELQGIKRGIMEMADMIAITKADGNNIDKAKLAQAEYKNALHLYPPTESGWIPCVETCSSVTKNGVNNVWQIINQYVDFTRKNGYFLKRRQQQSKYWIYETINESLHTRFFNDEKVQSKLADLEKQVLNNKLSSFAAAQILLDTFTGNKE